jgi:hypothetical protein
LKQSVALLGWKLSSVVTRQESIFQVHFSALSKMKYQVNLSKELKMVKFRHRRVVVATALLFAWAIFFTAGRRHPSSTQPVLKRDNKPACILVGSEYMPSELETKWTEHAQSWVDDYCNHAAAFDSEIATWLQGVESNLDSHSVENLSTTVFSYFVHHYDCGTTKQSITSWIEPLSHSLRHPRAICKATVPDVNKEYVVDRNYLLLASRKNVDRPRVCAGRACQNILVDLGASTWHEGAGGASQSWFVERYARHGIEFDRFLMWEATPMTDSRILKDIPPDLWHKYQYFNVPASVDTTNPAAPLNIIKTIAQRGDFVVFKLDIDNYEVEGSIVDQLTSNPQLVELVDEFIYEEHVQFEPMVKCCWRRTAHPNRTLHDSYQLFLNLRKMGIRAHSWV